MAKKSFATLKKAEMPTLIIKAIEDLLGVMKSPIVYPTDQWGYVQENKLLSVVKAREDVYVNMTNLMNLIEIENETFKQDIIEGLKNTWEEMTIITTRNIGNYDFGVVMKDENGRPLSEEEKKEKAREMIEDNYLSNISKAKYLSAQVAYQILERIEELENPEELMNEKINKQSIGVIAELYAEN